MLTHANASNTIPSKKEGQKQFLWKEYLILVFAGVLAVILGLPSMWTVFEKNASTANRPVLLLAGGAILQSAFWMFLAVGVGLLLSQKTGLGAPILRGFLTGEKIGGKLRSHVFPSISLAIVVTLVVKSLDRWFFMPQMPGFSSLISQTSGWQAFLASFYGGITEEILNRLFFLTLFAWILSKFSHAEDKKPSPTAMWIAIVGSAVLFGLGHLPATLATTSFSMILLAREVILNGILAVVFGYLYWKRGLESSVMSHFTSDLIVHVILPFFSF